MEESSTHWNTIIIEGVPVVVCPFDKSHLVAKKRIQAHLIKCRQHYKGEKVPCPYNASEYLLKSELFQHLSNCKSKQLMDEQMLRQADAQPRRRDWDEAPFHVTTSVLEMDQKEEMWN